MPITQTLTSSFKAEVLLGVHDFRTNATNGDTFKLALYTSAVTLDANTTSYSSTNEATGTNYTAGGANLANLGVTTYSTSGSAGTGAVDFSDLTFANVTITARGCLIYNSTPSSNSNANTTLTNASVAALDFGSDRTATAGDFTIIFPALANTTAIIRIS